MKRFVFRLQSVLRIREFELDRASQRLAALEQENARREAALRQAEDRLRRGREIMAREARDGTEGERLAMRANGVTVGRAGVAQARRAVAELEPALAAARTDVRTARTRVRSLEKLRGRRAEAHRRESQAAEQAEIEELALGRIARRRAQERAERAQLGEREERVG